MSGLSGGSFPHRDADLRDALRVVAHALQLYRDVQNGYDDAEVSGQRLLSRHQVDAPLLQLEAPLVDDVVLGNDLLGESEVAVLQRVQ